MKLKELRKSKGVSQEEAANALGVSFRAYQNYEYEQREPNIEMLNKMADYFGTSVDKLLGRENKEQTALDELVGQFNMDLLEKKIVENYFALPKKNARRPYDFSGEIRQGSQRGKQGNADVRAQHRRSAETCGANA